PTPCRRGRLRQPALLFLELREASLLLLQLPYERLEPPRRLGQLANHPVVIRPLVLDAGQHHHPPGALPVSLGSPRLGSGPQHTKLFLSSLQGHLPLGQVARDYTIPSNQPGVHRGQRRQVSEPGSPVQTVVSRQQNW